MYRYYLTWLTDRWLAGVWAVDLLVIQEVGADKATDLMPLVLQLYNDFYTSDARWFIGDPTEMGDAAASEFGARHPEISDEAVQALRWCYQFDNK